MVSENSRGLPTFQYKANGLSQPCCPICDMPNPGNISLRASKCSNCGTLIGPQVPRRYRVASVLLVLITSFTLSFFFAELPFYFCFVIISVLSHVYYALVLKRFGYLVVYSGPWFPEDLDEAKRLRYVYQKGGYLSGEPAPPAGRVFKQS